MVVISDIKRLVEGFSSGEVDYFSLSLSSGLVVSAGEFASMLSGYTLEYVDSYYDPPIFVYVRRKGECAKYVEASLKKDVLTFVKAYMVSCYTV